MPIKERYRQNPQKYIEESTRYCQENKEKVKESKHNSYLKNKEERIKKAKIYYQENKEKINRRNNQRYIKNKEKYKLTQKRYFQNNKEKIYERARLYRRRIKLEIFNHYSGDPPKCDCCKEEQFEFLTIDHIDGSGREHRRQFGGRGGDALYQWLRRNNYPKGFRVLCYNCNCCIGHLGYCPHSREKQ